MSMKVLQGGSTDPSPQGRGPRILAPGAPPSPGPVPNDLAAHLKHGEVLAWWDSKDSIELGLFAVTFGASLVALALVSAFAPEMWSQPWSDLWGPIAGVSAPSIFVLVRQWMSRRSILVTHEALIAIDHDDTAVRLKFATLDSVDRDWVYGGLVLRAGNTRVRVPSELADDAGKAVRSRLRGMLRSRPVHDPLRWLE